MSEQQRARQGNGTGDRSTNLVAVQVPATLRDKTPPPAERRRGVALKLDLRLCSVGYTSGTCGVTRNVTVG